MTERAVWSAGQRQRLAAMGYSLLRAVVAGPASEPAQQTDLAASETAPVSAPGQITAHAALMATGRPVAIALTGPLPDPDSPEQAMLTAVLQAAGLQWQGNTLLAEAGDVLDLPALKRLRADADLRRRLWPRLRAWRRAASARPAP